MNDDELLLKKRFRELCDRANAQYLPVYTDFLNLYEQSVLLSSVGEENVLLFGGFETAERRMGAFGEKAGKLPFPIRCIEIEPLSQKFADDLTHRDFLGSVLALGLKREKVGDLLVRENSGFLFCAETAAEYIAENLKQVKHTDVRCRVLAELPEEEAEAPEEESIVVASLRLDALIAAVFHLSRSDSAELFLAHRVFVNGRLTENNSFQPKTGDVISVRSLGRFLFGGENHETKKGRKAVSIGLFR